MGAEKQTIEEARYTTRVTDFPLTEIKQNRTLRTTRSTHRKNGGHKHTFSTAMEGTGVMPSSNDPSIIAIKPKDKHTAAI
jgi:hypothetical protein